MTRVSASRNKARAKQDEKDVAEILGGTRHWADTGGKEDVEHPDFAIQVKGGLRVINGTIREGIEAAKQAAEGTGKLPLCILVDRSGTRVRRYTLTELEAFATWSARNIICTTSNEAKNSPVERRESGAGESAASAKALPQKVS